MHKPIQRYILLCSPRRVLITVVIIRQIIRAVAHVRHIVLEIVVIIILSRRRETIVIISLINVLHRVRRHYIHTIAYNIRFTFGVGSRIG